MFRKILEPLGEFWSVWEGIGMFGRVFGLVEILLSVWKCFGAFGRVLECLREFWRI